MTLNEYQEQAMSTCMETTRNYSYMMGNLVAEVGELQGKVSKAQRKGKLTFNRRGEIVWLGTVEEWAQFDNELMKEAGDILWQLAGLCTVSGWALENIGQGNLSKLASRQERGVIDGNGDNR